jgi:AcrR family transcriptional regulator
MSVPTESSVARGRPRDPRRREAILRAAIELVAEIGYDRMTVEALAARAGVSKPTIYRRWPGGKRDIVVDAIRSKHPDGESLPDTGSLRGDLLGLLCTGLEHDGDEDVKLAGGLISQLRESEELARIMREEVVAHGRKQYDTLLARAFARGEIAPGTRITPLFHDIAGSVIFTRAIVTGEPLDRPFLEELVDHVLLPLIKPLPKD